MGKYINDDTKGNSIGTTYREKIKNLINDGAIYTDGSYFKPDLVCVVDNGLFGAAGYCDTQGEFDQWHYPDGRPRTWLTYPHAEKVAK
jgi:hypothetical protein